MAGRIISNISSDDLFASTNFLIQIATCFSNSQVEYISITWTFISNSRAILCMVEAFVDNPFVNGIANTVSYSFFSSSNKS